VDGCDIAAQSASQSLTRPVRGWPTSGWTAVDRAQKEWPRYAGRDLSFRHHAITCPACKDASDTDSHSPKLLYAGQRRELRTGKAYNANRILWHKIIRRYQVSVRWTAAYSTAIAWIAQWTRSVVKHEVWQFLACCWTAGATRLARRASIYLPR